MDGVSADMAWSIYRPCHVMVADVDPFIRPYTTKPPVNGISRQLGASREVTEIGFHDRDNAKDGISRGRMGQLAGVYLCWVIKRISSEYSQLLPSKDG